MKDDKIPDGDHVARHVPWSRLRRDQDDRILGIVWQALQKRPTEDALSVSWLEFFGGTHRENLKQAAEAFRRTQQSGKIGTKSGFAVAAVSVIHGLCSEHGVNVRIVHEPIAGNEAHASIRRLPPDDSELLDILAVEAFAELALVADMEPG